MVVRSRATRTVLLTEQGRLRTATRSIVQLPPNDSQAPRIQERARFLAVVVLPWIVLYEATVLLHDHGTAFRLFIDDRIPMYP